MKTVTANLKATLSILLLAICATVYAQKLPGVQPSTGLRAPANIKIDGKTTEWDNKFQAYNHATDIFYTMANDDNNLYLTVQATDAVIAKKILGGGVKLTLNKSAKKNDDHPITIMFPVYNAKSYSKTSTLLSKIASNKHNNVNNDSLQYAINSELAAGEKEIGISGIKDITDTLISIYNSQGIKAIAQVDNKGALTYELAVPLKLIGAGEGARLMYNILLKGTKAMNNSHSVTMDDGGTMLVINKKKSDNISTAQIIAEYETLDASTDFWGEYTLAKK